MTYSPVHGLAMLQAASVALANQSGSSPAIKPPEKPSEARGLQTTEKDGGSVALDSTKQASYDGSLSALLNPAPLEIEESLPSGFVLGKDGKIKKKRGRKPTPGLSEEDRRKARLLKNRRTAEISRRRKLAQLHKLTEERDCAQRLVNQLSVSNEYLINKLATTLGISIEDLLKNDSNITTAHQSRQHLQLEQQLIQQQVKHPQTPPHSDISQYGSDDEERFSIAAPEKTN